MRFDKLARAYEELESTSKRLEMRRRLAELIRPIRPHEHARDQNLTQVMMRNEY